MSTIYNVIDTRQAEAQNTVIEALRALGYGDAADHYTHFSYEMVALTPRCASDMGYPLSEDEMGKAFIEVSGRRGFGVKADDLIDRLIASAQKEVDMRHPELSESERTGIATDIAVGRLALLHAEVHQDVGDRLRLQRSAQLRRRNRTIRAVCRCARDQHLP